VCSETIHSPVSLPGQPNTKWPIYIDVTLNTNKTNKLLSTCCNIKFNVTVLIFHSTLCHIMVAWAFHSVVICCRNNVMPFSFCLVVLCQLSTVYLHLDGDLIWSFYRSTADWYWSFQLRVNALIDNDQADLQPVDLWHSIFSQYCISFKDLLISSNLSYTNLIWIRWSC